MPEGLTNGLLPIGDIAFIPPSNVLLCRVLAIMVEQPHFLSPTEALKPAL